MCKAELGLLVKDNVSAIPLGLVFDKVDVTLQDTPYNFLAWDEFSDLLSAAMKVFVVELKFSTEFVGDTLNFF